jgi:hypothetical protein
LVLKVGRDEGPQLIENERRRNEQPGRERKASSRLESIAGSGEVEGGLAGNGVRGLHQVLT